MISEIYSLNEFYWWSIEIFYNCKLFETELVIYYNIRIFAIKIYKIWISLFSYSRCAVAIENICNYWKVNIYLCQFSIFRKICKYDEDWVFGRNLCLIKDELRHVKTHVRENTKTRRIKHVLDYEDNVSIFNVSIFNVSIFNVSIVHKNRNSYLANV